MTCPIPQTRSLQRSLAPKRASLSLDNGCFRSETARHRDACLRTTARPSSRRCCVSHVGSCLPGRTSGPHCRSATSSSPADIAAAGGGPCDESGILRATARLAPDMHPEACARHRALRRQLVHVWPDLRHQRPNTTTSFHARRPVGAAGRCAAFTVPSTTVVASACRTFSSGMALAASWSSIGYHSVTPWRVSSTSSR